MGSGFRGRVLVGLGGWPVPAWGGLVADGARPPQALETPVETRMFY